jgi:hypothetical protein
MFRLVETQYFASPTGISVSLMNCSVQIEPELPYCYPPSIDDQIGKPTYYQGRKILRLYGKRRLKSPVLS